MKEVLTNILAPTSPLLAAVIESWCVFIFVEGFWNPKVNGR